MAGVLIPRFTIAHLYLISDNRHYTFYIWRKLLGRSIGNQRRRIGLPTQGLTNCPALLRDCSTPRGPVWPCARVHLLLVHLGPGAVAGPGAAMGTWVLRGHGRDGGPGRPDRAEVLYGPLRGRVPCDR